jgi:protein involved in polysaccharide export with SLBB domain
MWKTPGISIEVTAQAGPIFRVIPVDPGEGAGPMNRRWQVVIVVGLCGAAAAGCSSCGLFGLGPPAHPLIPEARTVRDTAPVPAPVPRELAKILHAPYVVEPGDTLLVQPADPDAPVRLPPDQTVLPDGTIDLGKYGRPPVAGLTIPEIEAAVQAAVKAKEKDPVLVNVRLVGRASKVYYVLGEVNAPGAFPINGRETVLDAVVAAGNLTRRASQENIIISRPTAPEGCRIVFPVCWREIVQLGDTTTNYQVMPGDRIYVPSQTMCETLFSHRCQHRKACPACARPQVSCFGGAGCGDGGPGSPAGAARTRPPLPCRDGTCRDGSCGDPAPAIVPMVPPPPGFSTLSPIDSIPGPIPGPMPAPQPSPIPTSIPGPTSAPILIPQATPQSTPQSTPQPISFPGPVPIPQPTPTPIPTSIPGPVPTPQPTSFSSGPVVPPLPIPQPTSFPGSMPPPLPIPQPTLQPSSYSAPALPPIPIPQPSSYSAPVPPPPPTPLSNPLPIPLPPGS